MVGKIREGCLGKVMCALKIGRYRGILQLMVEEGIEGRTLDKNNSAQMRKCSSTFRNKDPTDRAKALKSRPDYG